MLKTGSAKNVYIGYFELPCSFPDYRFSVRPRIPVRHELMLLVEKRLNTQNWFYLFQIKGKKYFGSTRKGNGVQCIQKLNGSVLGWFRPSPSGGITTDPNGRVIGFGNVLASLIADLL